MRYALNEKYQEKREWRIIMENIARTDLALERKEDVKEEIEIVVPDKLSLFMEKFLFEHMQIYASFSIKVSTFNRFAKKCCVVDKEKQISKVGSILLIHKILNDNIDKLEVLKSKAFSFSYAEEIFRTIGQLKASKIGYEEMKLFK